MKVGFYKEKGAQERRGPGVLLDLPSQVPWTWTPALTSVPPALCPLCHFNSSPPKVVVSQWIITSAG